MSDDTAMNTGTRKHMSSCVGQLRKTAGNALYDEIKYIRDGVARNKLTRGEALGSSLAGGLVTALAGAGMGLATMRGGRKGDARRRVLKNLIVCGILGAAAGPVAAQYRKYMGGIAYDNAGVDLGKLKKGDKLYIGVSGSANGQGDSWFADEMAYRFPGRHYMLRHIDGDKLEKLYSGLRGKGVDVSVIGHSSGGKTAARFLKAHPEARGYLIDPVSWFGRDVPKNTVVFTADESTRHGGPFENYIADAGGRWNYTGPNSILFKGSHSNRMEDLLRDFVAKGIRPGDSVGQVPGYVTSVFGNGVSEQEGRP